MIIEIEGTSLVMDAEAYLTFGRHMKPLQETATEDDKYVLRFN